MHWTRQSIVYLTVATLLFLTVYSFFQFSEYKRYSRNIEHTYLVLNTTERIGSGLSQIMVLRRTYVLTPSPVLKDSIYSERDEIIHHIDSLQTLTQDNISQFNNTTQLLKIVNQTGLFSEMWHDTLPATVLVDSMRKYMREAKPMIDSAYRELDEIKRVEAKLLKLRSSFQKDSGDILPTMLLITGLTAILMLMYAFYIMNIDLKERLKAQKALERNVHQLNLANEELERFAFIASHNLKEPLRKSRTFISRMLPDVNPDSTIFPSLQKMEISMERLQKMLDDLLIFTKLLHHNETKELINLQKVVQTVTDQFEGVIAATNARIKIENLPEVVGYPYQVNLIFQHLFSNALKYYKPGEQPVIVISSRFNAESGHEVVVFADQGIGFDTAYSQKIFEVFGRLHSKDEYEGTGIGLAICRRAMFNHDGFIIADSSPDKGAQFSLYFPL